MIQEIMRSTLILGTVLVNACQLGLLAEPPKGVDRGTPPALPVSREATSALSSHLAAKRFEARLPRLISMRSGVATWYGKIRNGHRTANGELFDSAKLTGASNILPFGTRVKVTNLKNGKSVVVRVNDRGTLGPEHVIDVTSAAANRIGMLRTGVVPVHLDVLAAAL
jgi:rare lipoprotein A